jgi:hypothetical protein
MIPLMDAMWETEDEIVVVGASRIAVGSRALLVPMIAWSVSMTLPILATPWKVVQTASDIAFQEQRLCSRTAKEMTMLDAHLDIIVIAMIMMAADRDRHNPASVLALAILLPHAMLRILVQVAMLAWTINVIWTVRGIESIQYFVLTGSLALIIQIHAPAPRTVLAFVSPRHQCTATLRQCSMQSVLKASSVSTLQQMLAILSSTEIARGNVRNYRALAGRTCNAQRDMSASTIPLPRTASKAMGLTVEFALCFAVVLLLFNIRFTAEMDLIVSIIQTQELVRWQQIARVCACRNINLADWNLEAGVRLASGAPKNGGFVHPGVCEEVTYPLWPCDGAGTTSPLQIVTER